MTSTLLQLVRAMRASGLTQQQIAAKAGVSQAVVSRILAGERKPSLELAEKLAAAVGKKLQLK